MLAAGVIWALIAWYYQSHDIPYVVEVALRHTLEEYAELLLFLIVAMTYINAMEDRNVFEALRTWLIRKEHNESFHKNLSGHIKMWASKLYISNMESSGSKTHTANYYYPSLEL